MWSSHVLGPAISNQMFLKIVACQQSLEPHLLTFAPRCSVAGCSGLIIVEERQCLSSQLGYTPIKPRSLRQGPTITFYYSKNVLTWLKVALQCSLMTLLPNEARAFKLIQSKARTLGIGLWRIQYIVILIGGVDSWIDASHLSEVICLRISFPLDFFWFARFSLSFSHAAEVKVRLIICSWVLWCILKLI
jgi:hypothetical protein